MLPVSPLAQLCGELLSMARFRICMNSLEIDISKNCLDFYLSFKELKY
jgi:hypothetical protein